MTKMNSEKNIKYIALIPIIVALLVVQATQLDLTPKAALASNENIAPMPFGPTPEPTEKPALVEESTAPRTGVTLPPNAIATPEGGYVTISHSTDENGKPLNIKYAVGEKTIAKTGDVVPACRGPNVGLYQEGVNSWTVSSTADQIGFSDNWQMPTGGLTGTSVGIFYNPVNFHYPATGTNYDFFQTTFGIGNSLAPIGPGWKMIYSWVAANGTRLYGSTSMAAVTVSGGSTYRIDATLQPFPLANPSAYVIQVSKGANSWIYSQPLGYTPSAGSVNNFQSYQDQWLLSSGSSTLSSDTVGTPKLARLVGGSLTFDATKVTGKAQADTLSAVTGLMTRDILSPSSINATALNNIRECSSIP